MTASITTSYRIGIVAGTGVTTAGPVVPAITTDDIFNPDSPTQTLTDMLNGISSAKLLGSSIVNCTAIGNASLFTVPTGKIMIPTEVIFALTVIGGSGAVPVIHLGYSGAFQEYIDGTLSFSGFTTVGHLKKVDDLTASTATAYGWTPAGSTLTLRVATAATYSAYKMMCYVFGYVTTTPPTS